MIDVKKSPWMQSETGLPFSPRAVVKAVLLAMVMYVVLAFVITVAISFRSNLETKLSTLAYVAQYLTVLIGGMAAGRMAGRSGWLHGLGVGILFMVVISAGGKLFLSTQLSMISTLLWRILPGALLGLGGGALGANL